MREIALKIIVLVKQVPSAHEIRINKAQGTVQRDGFDAMINTDDRHALELGLFIKEKFGGEVLAISMGPTQSEGALRECLAMGVDRAILLSHERFAMSDTLQTTFVLERAIRKVGSYDLIITGSKTVDSGTGHVPSQLSEALEIPLISEIYRIEFNNGYFEGERTYGHEYQSIKVALPIIIKVDRTFNMVRYNSLLGIKKAFEKKIDIWDFETFECPDEIDGCEKSPTRLLEIIDEEIVRKNQEITGTSDEKAQKIVDLIKKVHIQKIKSPLDVRM